MRNVQVTIKVDDISDVNNPRNFSIYADSNNIWEAICAALDELMVALKEDGDALPGFGARSHMKKELDVYRPVEK